MGRVVMTAKSDALCMLQCCIQLRGLMLTDSCQTAPDFVAMKLGGCLGALLRCVVGHSLY